MKPNPISFLLVSMVLGTMVLALAGIALMSIRIEMVSEYSSSTIYTEGVRSVNVKSIVGSITITGEERSDILIKTEVETIFGKRVLDRVEIEVTSGPEVIIRVKSSVDTPIFNVHMEVWMPSDIPLGTVQMDHGNIKVTGMYSLERCRMDNGLMDIRSVRSIGNLSLNNGDIEVRSAGTIRGVIMDNGNIFVQMENITSNGASFHIDNGDIIIEVPNTLPADFDLEVANGHLGIEGLGPVYDTKGSNTLRGSLNGGGPALKADITIGNVLLRSYELEGDE